MDNKKMIIAGYDKNLSSYDMKTFTEGSGGAMQLELITENNLRQQGDVNPDVTQLIYNYQHISTNILGEALEMIRIRYPNAYVIVVFTEDIGAFSMRVALKHGAEGLLSRHATEADMKACLAGAYTRHSYFMCPYFMDIAVKDIIKNENHVSFTPKQLEIINAAGKSLSLKETAVHLSISLHTVAQHRRIIMKKLGVHAMKQALIKVKELGL